jgi:GTP-binding protein HflX
VIDANAEDRDETIAQVNQVLEDIEANEIRQLQVFNKIDLLPDIEPHIDRDDEGNALRVWLSAETGAGIDLLYQVLAEIFASSKVRRQINLLPTQGDVRAKLFRLGTVLEEEVSDTGGWDLLVEIDKKHLGVLKSLDKLEA